MSVSATAAALTSRPAEKHARTGGGEDRAGAVGCADKHRSAGMFGGVEGAGAVAQIKTGRSEAIHFPAEQAVFWEIPRLPERRSRCPQIREFRSPRLRAPQRWKSSPAIRQKRRPSPWTNRAPRYPGEAMQHRHSYAEFSDTKKRRQPKPICSGPSPRYFSAFLPQLQYRTALFKMLPGLAKRSHDVP